MDEANASYHAAAHANKYDIPKEIQKSGKKHLSNASRIHEISEVKKIISDNTNRLLGKIEINKKIWKLIQISINSIITFRNIPYPWI